MRQGFIAHRNSTVVWIEGVVDETNPTNSDGSPNYLNDATGTWDLLDAGTDDPETALSTGLSIASGTISFVSNGTYLIEISSAITIAAINWLHVVLTTSTGYKADLLGRFDQMTRSGNTPST